MAVWFFGKTHVMQIEKSSPSDRNCLCLHGRIYHAGQCDHLLMAGVFGKNVQALFYGLPFLYGATGDLHGGDGEYLVFAPCENFSKNIKPLQPQRFLYTFHIFPKILCVHYTDIAPVIFIGRAARDLFHFTITAKILTKRTR